MSFFSFLKDCQDNDKDMKKALILLQEEKDLIREPKITDLIRKAILYREISMYDKSLDILEKISESVGNKKYDEVVYQKILTLKEMSLFAEALKEFPRLEHIDQERRDLREFLSRML